MSRIGKAPVEVPSDVQVNLADDQVVIKGSKGELNFVLSDQVVVTLNDGTVVVNPANDSKRAKAMWGTVRSIISNMIQGVSKGYEIRLEIKGVGYRAALKGKILVLNLGFSHDIFYALPDDIEIKCEKPTLIVISGADKQKVGRIAGEIIKLRPVEPYKGKGVYIEGSWIRRKEGKKK